MHINRVRIVEIDLDEAERIVAEPSVQRGFGRHGRRAGHKRVTVRLGLSHGSKANDSTGPGPHLDDNRLAEQSRRLIENDATDGVRCTAGGEWADHLECSHRPLLRVRRERPRRRAAEQRDELAAFH